MIVNAKRCPRCGESDRDACGACRPCKKAYASAYQKTHQAECLATVTRWQKANPERKRGAAATYRAANLRKVKERTDKWRTAHPERVREQHSKWLVAHPENKRASDHKRRAGIKKGGGSFTATDIRALLKTQRGKCVACRGKISGIYHIDHIMPLALGGSNGISNIQLLCPRCNLSKKDKHPITFMQSRGFLL